MVAKSKSDPKNPKIKGVAKTAADKLRDDPQKGGFPIVGIGASAGGLEALEQFFGNMPFDSGMAFVVIQHLDPTHVGIMPELLQRITRMKVIQATDKVLVKPDCVYVIPPNKSLSLLHGALHLFDPVESRGLRLPIDIFFRSLALDMMERSIGIILSGMGSDGSLGLKAIKEANGTVLVQDPASAKFDGMPGSATEAVVADIVAPADELPVKLLAFLKFIPTAVHHPETEDKLNSNLDKIIILLREQTSHDFSQYKKNTLFRRIERRKGIHQIDKIQSYIRFLQENPKEIEILFKELLIGVTSFFRDGAVWEALKEKLVTQLLDNLPAGYVLRAWVTGCSTGEEAYSLAMIFKEAMDKLKTPKNLSLQIFATDLDQDAIEIARKGLFPLNITADVNPERLTRFFSIEPAGYRVNAAIREMVVFAPQNVIKDPPFTKLDLITCRNMLIYMEPELQKKLMVLFHYSLNPGGIMMLGTAETLGNQNDGFKELDTKCKIFQRSPFDLANSLFNFPSSFYHPKSIAAKKSMAPIIVENIQALTDQIILQQFAPASVLVNDTGDLVYITGRTGKYLEPAAGKANMNIYAMAREGLRQVLPAAFRNAAKNFDASVIHNIKIDNNGTPHFIDLTVQRLSSPEAVKGLILFLFHDMQVRSDQDPVHLKTGKRMSTAKHRELEQELQHSLEDLQSTREEMQTSQEELKSTNEELQSTNEELQSTNEELTTSKEEMQSLNEELQTVNAELQSKVTDYARANDDMKNLLNSTEIATLFLDKELNIRRFTDQAIHVFKLRNSDIGRPFTDLATDLKYPEIDKHARQVIKSLISTETAITTIDGRWFNVRIMPYRTVDDHIDGLVMTFTNISEYKRLEIELKKTNEALTISETRYRHLFESAKEGMLIMDAESGEIIDVNPFLIEMLGYTQKQFFGKPIWEIGFLKNIFASKHKLIEFSKKVGVKVDEVVLKKADGQKIHAGFISNIYSVNNYKEIRCQIREIK
ncbi:MAG: chemotaxis protein CheB [Bacteroidales bacterium]|jgi:two-component system CheB/CheR fusion protein